MTRDRYECTECGYTSDDLSLILDHVEARHCDPFEYVTDRHNEEPPGWRA